jgi:transposase
MIVASAVDGFFAAGADIRHMSSADAASFAAYGDRMRRQRPPRRRSVDLGRRGRRPRTRRRPRARDVFTRP